MNGGPGWVLEALGLLVWIVRDLPHSIKDVPPGIWLLLILALAAGPASWLWERLKVARR